MRALIKNEDGTLEVVEFIDMYIDESDVSYEKSLHLILPASDIQAAAVMRDEECYIGFKATISLMDVHDYNDWCQKLLTTGYIDLSKYTFCAEYCVGAIEDIADDSISD